MDNNQNMHVWLVLDLSSGEFRTRLPILGNMVLDPCFMVLYGCINFLQGGVLLQHVILCLSPQVFPRGIIWHEVTSNPISEIKILALGEIANRLHHVLGWIIGEICRFVRYAVDLDIWALTIGKYGVGGFPHSPEPSYVEPMTLSKTGATAMLIVTLFFVDVFGHWPGF